MAETKSKPNKLKKTLLISLPFLALLVFASFALFVEFFADFSDNQKFEIISEKNNWSAGEDPEFRINNSFKGIKIRASLANSKNETLILKQGRDFELNSSSSSIIKIFKPEKFRPGKYRLEVTAEKNGQILGIQEKEFTWGVLVINFNKSIYTLEDERSHIQMAVLNDKGNTICNADLEMTIISPEGNMEYFSTDNGNIEYSGECKGDSYVEVPDYFAYYELPYSQGEYMVELTAYTYNGIRTIVDFFQVREFVPFEIERIGPARIYPPADYQVSFIIKANQDFKGEMIERVPEQFSIFENEITNSKFQIRDSNQNEKQIVWDVELKKGETYEFSYQFNAPNISPYLYLLGPLSFEKVLP